MSRTTEVGLPAILLLAGAAVALSIVHFVAYLVRLGADPNLAAAISTGSHAYWPIFVIATMTFAALAALRTRHRLERAPSRPSGDAPLGRQAMAIWFALVAFSTVGFVFMENAEALLGSGRLVGLAPLGWLTQPLVALSVAVCLSLVTGAVVLVLKARSALYTDTLVSTYRELVRTGTYSAAFTQSDWARRFVSDVLGQSLAAIAPRPMSILECGSGTGIWLADLSVLTAGREVRLHGFDLSPEMVEAARQRFANLGSTVDVQVSDLFDPRAYDFDGTVQHDAVYAFDVIQQLPGDLQARAVAALYDHVAPGGWLLIFDHDRRSRYGRVMGLKKWLRRHFDLPLVPRFYIHARYPDLRALRWVLERMGGTEVSIRVEQEGRKRALIARRPAR
jgi:SAM-dependent methyltransferase